MSRVVRRRRRPRSEAAEGDPSRDGRRPEPLHRLLELRGGLQGAAERRHRPVLAARADGGRSVHGHAGRHVPRPDDVVPVDQLLPLRQPAVRQSLSDAGDLQDGQRHRQRELRTLHRLSLLHGGLPLRQPRLQLAQASAGAARPASPSSATRRPGPRASSRNAPSACSASPTGCCRAVSSPAPPARASSATSTIPNSEVSALLRQPALVCGVPRTRHRTEPALPHPHRSRTPREVRCEHHDDRGALAAPAPVRRLTRPDLVDRRPRGPHRCWASASGSTSSPRVCRSPTCATTSSGASTSSPSCSSSASRPAA